MDGRRTRALLTADEDGRRVSTDLPSLCAPVMESYSGCVGPTSGGTFGASPNLGLGAFCTRPLPPPLLPSNRPDGGNRVGSDLEVVTGREC